MKSGRLDTEFESPEFLQGPEIIPVEALKKDIKTIRIGLRFEPSFGKRKSNALLKKLRVEREPQEANGLKAPQANTYLGS